MANVSGIHPGDTLEVVKPVTPQWVHFMGMDHLVRNGKPQEWVKNDIRVLRQVASVEGNAVTLSVPLTDSFDAQFYPGTQPPITRVEITGRIAETGIEICHRRAAAHAALPHRSRLRRYCPRQRD